VNSGKSSRSFTNFAIPQQLFSQLCLLAHPLLLPFAFGLTGEADLSVTPPAPMWRGAICCNADIRIQTLASPPPRADNCTNAETAASFRYLMYAAQFTSPDEASGYNFLTTQALGGEYSVHPLGKQSSIQVATSAGHHSRYFI